MSVEENKTIVRKYWLEAWGQGHVDILDTIYAPDGSVPDQSDLQGIKDLILWHHKIAPNLKITILDMVGEGEKVVIFLQADLTYSVIPDPPPTPPTYPYGKLASWKVMILVRVVDGKIVSEVSANEWTDMLVKAGVYVLAQLQPA